MPYIERQAQPAPSPHGQQPDQYPATALAMPNTSTPESITDTSQNGYIHSTRAWIVLLTRPSYLPGVIVLGHSLQKVKSEYPLVVAVTPTLPQYAVETLLDAGLQVKHIEPLKPSSKVAVVAERFEDTWTKLALFGFEEYEKAIMLDGDMMVMRNMDELFDIDLPQDWIAANHACVCNLDRDAWAPDDWREENCAYTGQIHPSALTAPCTITPSSIRTHTLLNSGLVIFHPSQRTLKQMLHIIQHSPIVSTFAFPDQDFLTYFYAERWKPLGWQYNAIKTARHWHASMWSDDAVRNIHYIVDKPWNTGRISGADTETHGWWWDALLVWEREMLNMGEVKTVESVRRHAREGSGSGVVDGAHGTGELQGYRRLRRHV